MKMSMIILIFMNLMLPMIYMFIFPDKSINPVYVGTILFISIIMSMIPMSLYAHNNLISFISFMILIGGLMMLFMYFTSFTSTGSLNMNWKKMQMIIMSMMLYIMMIISYMNKFHLYLPFSNSNDSQSIFNLMKSNKFDYEINIHMMYSYESLIIMMFMLFFLFICLTIIVKMCLNNPKNIRKVS
nr:NADH dehydrogenase subunit 6 [Ceratosolen fusciceps]